MKGNLAWNQCVWLLNFGSHWVFPSNDIRIHNYSALHVVLVVQRASVCFVFIFQSSHLLFPKLNDKATFIPPHWEIAAPGFRKLFDSFLVILCKSFLPLVGDWVSPCMPSYFNSVLAIRGNILIQIFNNSCGSNPHQVEWMLAIALEQKTQGTQRIEDRKGDSWP